MDHIPELDAGLGPGSGQEREEREERESECWRCCHVGRRGLTDCTGLRSAERRLGWAGAREMWLWLWLTLQPANNKRRDRN